MLTSSCEDQSPGHLLGKNLRPSNRPNWAHKAPSCPSKMGKDWWVIPLLRNALVAIPLQTKGLRPAKTPPMHTTIPLSTLLQTVNKRRFPLPCPLFPPVQAEGGLYVNLSAGTGHEKKWH